MDLNDIESEFFERLFPVEMEVPINATLNSDETSIEMVVIPQIDQSGNFLLEYTNAAPHMAKTKNGWVQWGDDGFGTHPVLEQAWMNHDLCSLTLRRSVMFSQTQAEWTVGVEVVHAGSDFRGRLALARNRVILEDGLLQEAHFSISDFPDFTMGTFHPLTRQAEEARKMLAILIPTGATVSIQPPPRNIVLESKDGWMITLTKDVGGSRGSVSHTVVVTRCDGAKYEIADLEMVLEGLKLFFAFVRGDYCLPTAVIGYAYDGDERSWRAIWGLIGRFAGESRRQLNWFVNPYDMPLGSRLETLFRGFWEMWSSHREQVDRAIDLYVQSGHSRRNGNPGSAITESYAGLEILAGVCRNITIDNNSAQEIDQVLQHYDVPLRTIDHLPSQQFGQLAQDIGVDCKLAQIHRKGLATVREGRMRGAGSRRRGLDPLQSGWAQGVIATPRGC